MDGQGRAHPGEIIPGELHPFGHAWVKKPKKKRIALDAERQIPTAQDCRSSLLARGRRTQRQSIPGFVRIPGLRSLPTLSLQSLQQSAFGVSLTYQPSLHLSAFTKI